MQQHWDWGGGQLTQQNVLSTSFRSIFTIISLFANVSIIAHYNLQSIQKLHFRHPNGSTGTIHSQWVIDLSDSQINCFNLMQRHMGQGLQVIVQMPLPFFTDE
jgi:hypothetical protein